MQLRWKKQKRAGSAGAAFGGGAAAGSVNNGAAGRAGNVFGGGVANAGGAPAGNPNGGFGNANGMPGGGSNFGMAGMGQQGAQQGGNSGAGSNANDGDIMENPITHKIREALQAASDQEGLALRRDRPGCYSGQTVHDARLMHGWDPF